MVPSDRATTSSYKLSIVTKSLCAAVWPQFSMQSFNLSVTVSHERSPPNDPWASGLISVHIVCSVRAFSDGGRRSLNRVLSVRARDRTVKRHLCLLPTPPPLMLLLGRGAQSTRQV